MPTIPEADITAMLNTSELADTATIESTSVPGIFDNEYLADLDMSGTSPAFTCSAATIAAITPAVTRGTTVTINSVSYTIEVPKNSNDGLITFVLSEQ